MRLVSLALVLALAACAGGVRGGGGGLPEVAMQARTDTVVPPGRGWRQGLAVRSFVIGADGQWQEVAGATCQVAGGDLYRAALVTPARLVLPDIGPDAPVIRADCAAGAARGADAVAPAYGWPAEGRPDPFNRVFWNNNGWWWGFQKTGPLRYPDLAVGMR
jgi:hypothetical protein